MIMLKFRSKTMKQRLFSLIITIAVTLVLTLICYKTLPIYAQTLTEEYFKSGVEKADSGDYQGAIKDFNKAIELNPKYAGVYNNRGVAIEDYNKAIKINSKYAKAYFNRGLAKLVLGQKDSGCLDVYKAGELEKFEGYEVIKEYCN